MESNNNTYIIPFACFTLVRGQQGGLLTTITDHNVARKGHYHCTTWPVPGQLIGKDYSPIINRINLPCFKNKNDTMSIDFNWFNRYFRTKAPRGWVSRWVLSRLCCEQIWQLSCDSCGSSSEGEPSRDTEYFLHDNTITSRQRPPEEYWSKAARHTTGRALKSFSNIE